MIYLQTIQKHIDTKSHWLQNDTKHFRYDPIGNLIEDAAEGITNITWTVYGKVKSVTKTSIAFGPDLEFAYGPDGQRISKKAIYGTDSTVTTYYTRCTFHDKSELNVYEYSYMDSESIDSKGL